MDDDSGKVDYVAVKGVSWPRGRALAGDTVPTAIVQKNEWLIEQGHVKEVTHHGDTRK